MLIYRAARYQDYGGMLQVLESANMHHIPSKEMPELNVQGCFVCTTRDGEIIGMSGWKRVNEEIAKTTLMAVSPDHRGNNIGHTLQTMRMIAAHWSGCDIMVTNADRPDTIAWYKKHFGYTKIGSLQKEHEFGLPEVDEWTTLETSLGEFFRCD